MEKKNSQPDLSSEILKASEEKYRMLAENISDIIWTYNMDAGQFTYISPSVFEMSGYMPEEVLQKGFAAFLTPESTEMLMLDIQGELQHFFETGKARKFYSREVQIITKQGKKVWCEILTRFKTGVNGETVAIGVARNVDKRKYAEEAVLQERRLLRTLIDNLPDTIYIKDKEGRKLIANPADLKVLGYSSEAEVIGKTDLDLLNPEIGARGYNDDMAILRQQQPVINHEEDFIDSDGNHRWLYTTKMPLFDGSGSIMGLVGIGRDITERRKTEQQLAKQAKELGELNATKDKFFSIIAHDLRSPFNVFLNLTQILEEDFSSMSPEEMFKFIRSMGTSASNLFRLLENLLEWSRMQRGMIKVDPVSFLLLPNVKSSLDLARESANRKDIEFTYCIPGDLFVYADEKMLDSTLRNLSSNAVKFTPKGGKIIIEAKPISGTVVEISVKDTGIGMNKAMIDGLFKIDVDINRKGTDGEPSSGLGLILCREFVEKNRGELRVESEKGKGTTFYFTVPVQARS